MQNLILVRPSNDYRESCLTAIEEFKAESSSSLSWYYNLGDNFVDYIKELIARTTLKTEKMVPETVLWGVIDNEFVGRISIRHDLNEFLSRVGGHIGYEVRPSYRGLGIGTKMLEQALPIAKRVGLDKVLLTCDETNVGSIKIILANGGVLENVIEMGEGKPGKQRYWIQL
jgi:predicted acetyltransferase